MACLIAAGNDGDTNRHHSISVAPMAMTATFGFTVSNAGAGSSYAGPEDLRVLWQDSNATDNNLTLSCTNLGAGELLTAPWAAQSIRGTEARQYLLNVNLSPGASKVYNLRLQNTAITGNTPLVHTWRVGGRGTFVTPDASYTINHPGVADTAITIGAYTQANEWRDWQNNLWQFQTWPAPAVAPFSSRGPRIDAFLKPNVCAPGAVTLSCRDSGTFPGIGFPQSLYTIDNDGNNDGLGPADYYVRWGTSMATPMAAGNAALLLHAAPGMTPAQLLATLESTATNAANPNNIYGAGLIDIKSAIGDVVSTLMS
jgi:subtilisin family serine protease